MCGGHGALTEFAAGTARAWLEPGPGAPRLEGGYSRDLAARPAWSRSPDLSYGRYFLNLAFRIYSRGETPQEPEHLGEPVR